MTNWDELYKNEALRNREGNTPPAPCVMDWADQMFNFSIGPVILDVGCGTGRNAFGLVDRGAIVHGCDHATSIIEHLRQTASTRFASLHVCEADDLPYEDMSFDGAFCDEVLFYLPAERIRTAFREMFRVLRYQGAMFCRTTDADDKRNIGPGSLDHGMPMTFLTASEICSFAEEAGFMILWLKRNLVAPKRRTRMQDWLISAIKPLSS